MTEGRTRRGILAGAAGLAGSLSGCSLGGDSGGGSTGRTTLTPASVPTVDEPLTVDVESDRALTVAHWYQADDKQAGFEAMAEPFRTAAGVDVRRPDGWSASLTRNGMAERVARGYPPGIWQVDPGTRLAWPVERDLLTPLRDGVWSDRDVRAGYPREVEALAAYRGRYVAVPWHGERLNNLFYNPGLFDRADVEPADVATQGFPAVAATIAAETGATPVAISTDAPWQVGQLFESLLVAEAGVGTLENLVAGRIDATVRTAVESTLDTIAALSAYLPDDAGEISRSTAVARVLAGTAATTVCRDGAVGGPAAETGFAAGEADGGTWAHVPLPGTEGVFQFTTSAFAAPANNPTPDLSRAWLRYVAGPAAQRRFCSKSATVPLRTDVDPGPLPTFARRQYAAYRGARERIPSLTHGLTVPEGVYPALLTAFFEFTDDWDADRTARLVLDALDGESETPSPPDRRD